MHLLVPEVPQQMFHLNASYRLLKMTRGLEECGTTMEYDSGTEKINFTVSFFSNLNPGILNLVII